jgi:uncharacterized protein
LNGNFNYVRNSVKAVVDAYDGTVTLYIIDPDDPLVNAYAQAFPELFAPIEDMPGTLIENLRYPEDLFTVQTNMWGRYWIDDPQEFYAQDRAWNVAQDPGVTVDGSGAGHRHHQPRGRADRHPGPAHRSLLPAHAPPG